MDTPMAFTTLGRTGLRVSVAGLGCGGSSRLGLAQGRSAAEAAALVRHCIDRGVTFIDTAGLYGTEDAVGLALAGVDRDSVLVSTKAQIVVKDQRLPASAVLASLDDSLRALGLDHVDVFHLHGVPPAHYEHALAIRDALQSAQAAGKFRFLGITETGPFDPGHKLLARAIEEPGFDVVMTAFHLLNQNTRDAVFARTRVTGTGTLIMFAVRAIFSQPGRLRETLDELALAGRLGPEVLAELAAGTDPLGFLVHPAGARSLIDAAYRFVRHEPGVDVTLFGTGSAAHASANIDSILAPALPAADLARLAERFGHLEGVGLTLPEPAAGAAAVRTATSG